MDLTPKKSFDMRVEQLLLEHPGFSFYGPAYGENEITYHIQIEE